MSTEKTNTKTKISNTDIFRRRNRFVVEFPKTSGIESYLVQTVKLPKFTASNGWSKVEITFLDIVPIKEVNSISTIFVLHTAASKNNLFTEMSNSIRSNVFKIFIKSLDAIGEEIDRWEIKVKDFEIDFGTYDYASNTDSSIIKMILEPKDCIFSINK